MGSSFNSLSAVDPFCSRVTASFVRQCLHTKLNCLLSSVFPFHILYLGSCSHSPLPLCFLWCCGLASVAPPPPSVLQITPQLPLTGFVARVQETSKWLWASLMRPSCIQRHTFSSMWLVIARHAVKSKKIYLAFRAVNWLQSTCF